MKNTPKIIGVCGGMHSGKGQVIQILSEMFPDYKVDMFAYPLKLYISTLTGDSINKFENVKYKSELHTILGIAPREAMTTLGKFTVTNFKSNVLTESLFNRNRNSSIIISDLRLPDEADAIRKRGGFIIKVNRYFDLRFPGLKDYVHPHNRYNFNDRTLSFDYPEFYQRLTHYTETNYDKIHADITIENNSSINDLKKVVKHLWT